jgi:hypothetical protein
MHIRGIAAAVAALSWLGAGAAIADDTLAFAFASSQLRIAGISPEGCYLEPGVAGGALVPPAAIGLATCHAGALPVTTAAFAGDPDDPQLIVASDFVSAPLTGALALGSFTTIAVHYASDRTNYVGRVSHWCGLVYALDELRSDGTTVALGAGTAIEVLSANWERTQHGAFDIGDHDVAAGSRLRLRLGCNQAVDPAGRLLYGGTSINGPAVVGIDPLPVYDYGDAGITFTRRSNTGSRGDGESGSAFPDEIDEPVSGLEPGTDEGTPTAEASSSSGGGGAAGPGFLAFLLAAVVRRRTKAQSTRHTGGEPMKHAHLLLLTTVLTACGSAAPPDAEPRAAAAEAAQLTDLALVSGPSPFAPDGCGQHDVPVYQALPNEIDGFDGQQFGEEADVSIAVNPHDPRHLVAAWVQDAALGLSTAASFDAGRSWARTTIPGLTTCNGGAQERVFHARLAFGPDGQVYLAGEADDGLFPNPRQAASIRVPTVTSIDGGVSWGAVSFVDAGTADGGAKGLSTLAAEPDVGGAALVAWHNEPTDGVRGTWVSRTTDGGRTWTRHAARSGEPGRLPFNRILALRDGTLLLMGVDAEFVPTVVAGAPGPVRLVPTPVMPVVLQRSTDKGATWSTPVTITDNATIQWPAAVEAPDGTLYLAWLGVDATGAIVQYVARSTDAGQTWSEPVAAASPDHPVPALAAAGNGTIGFVYLDHRRDDPATEAVERDAWLAYSQDRGVTWHELHIAGPFDLAYLSTYMETTGLPRGFAASVLLGPPYSIDGPSDVFVAQVRTPG